MKKYYILTLIILAVSFLFAAAPVVSDVQVIPETGRVVITYDLAASGQCKVIVLVSPDGGSSYNIYPTALTGHVGDSVMPGANQIIWSPASDNVEIGDQYKVKIIARDNPVDTEEQFESFVKITGGTFNNGTADVTISDFYMSKYEVTQGEYEAVMGSNPSAFSGSNKPVERVSWFNAIKYCNIRSLQEGLTPCYNYNTEGTDPNEWSSGWNSNDNHENYAFDTTANGYRLPTEMEWMYAAKGGNQEPANGYNQYAGTNDLAQLTNYAWYWDNNSPSGTKEVATTLYPNQLGLYDMSGNVFEWCWDIRGSYSSSAQSDPVGPATGSHRVNRGGSWGGSAANCRVAIRSYYYPTFSYSDIGFRLARSIPISAPQTVADPVISPEGGEYDEIQTITLTCETEDAEIYYTLDGSDPDQTSGLYTETFELDETTIVKARAYKTGWDASAIVTEVYEINISTMPEEFILVEGGTFNNSYANVTISDFYMSKYELTQAEYQAVMGSNPSYFSGSDKPVEQVTWFNAIKYCNLRSLQEGLTPCYNYNNEGTNPSGWSSGWNSDANHTSYVFDTTANGYRLPTEMEWMYAAKGGNQQPASGYNQWAGTNIEAQLTNYAWYDLWSAQTTYVVGTKLPNQIGLYDMSGNVWEWCWDIRGEYSYSAQSNPVGSTTGPNRVYRGGSWDGPSFICKVAQRNSNIPSYSFNGMGFRLARKSE